MIDLKWIAKEMVPNKWYTIKDEAQLKEWQRQISFRFGWPVFQLSLSPDFKQVKKTMI
jgi:hypothetical protein